MKKQMGRLVIMGRDTQWGLYKKSVLMSMYHNVVGVTTNKLSEIMRLLTKLIKRFWHWFTGFDCQYEEYKACDVDTEEDKEDKQGGFIYWDGHGKNKRKPHCLY